MIQCGYLVLRYKFVALRRREQPVNSDRKSTVCTQGGSLLLGGGNNPMVGMTVSVAVAVEEALKA